MYDHIADSYNELHGAEQRRKLSLLLSETTLPDGPVLDVGCATAHLSVLFSGREYVGLDPSEPLLSLAPKGVRLVHGRGEELPFEDASFPVVLSLTALHNYSDWFQGVDELVRVSSDLVLVGVLKKSAEHDEIVSRLTHVFHVDSAIDDQHDSLLVLRKF